MSTPSEPPEPEDTPEEELRVTLPDVVAAATKLAALRRRLKQTEEEVAIQTTEVLRGLQQVQGLRGIRLSNGDAVRKTWVTSQSKVSPEALRSVLPDASEYLYEVVDAKRLKQDYEREWFVLAKVRSRETVTVRLVDGTDPHGVEQ